MADYKILLENLLKRRYDEARQLSVVSESFESRGYHDSIRYALESMVEIDHSYSYKIFSITRKIQDAIDHAFENTSLHVDFRYEGPIQTDTHITLFGDVELLVLIQPQTEKPWQEIQALTKQIIVIINGVESVLQVDFKSLHEISVLTQKPTYKIMVQPAIWLNNKGYLETKREIDRGICEFNFNEKTKRNYLPFLNIARINSKDERTSGGLKRLIRLLRSLQKDTNSNIQLAEHEIAAIVYAIPEKQLKFSKKQSLSLLAVASAQLTRLSTDKKYLETLRAPSDKEVAFGKKPKVEEIVKLKKLLDTLIHDIQLVLSKENKDLYSEILY